MNLKRSLALAMATVMMFTSVNLTGNMASAADYSAEESLSDVLTEESMESETDYSIEDEIFEEDIQLTEDEIEDTDSFDPIEEVTEDEDVSFCANAIIYLVANGGVFPSGDTSLEYNIRTRDISDAAYRPTLEGKMFKGWYADEECTQQLSLSDDPLDGNVYWLRKMPVEGITLYAGWADAYKLTYIFGNESGDDPIKDTGYYYDTENEPYERLKSVQYMLPAERKRKYYQYPNERNVKNTDLHYQFSGWYKDEARTQKVDDISKEEPTEDTTYYAGFNDRFYTITYHSLHEGGYFTQDLNASNQNGTKYETMTVLHAKDTSTHWVKSDSRCIENTDPRQAIAGYECYDKSGKLIPQDERGRIVVNGDVDIYVSWTATNKVVTFIAGDNGDGFISEKYPVTDMSVTKKSFGFASDVTSPYINLGHVKSKDLHKEFLGWSTTEGATEPEIKNFGSDGIASASFSLPDTDVTYYGVWKSSYHVVEIDAGEGTFSCLDPLTGGQLKNVSKMTTKTNNYDRLNYFPGKVVSNDPDKILYGWSDGSKIITYSLASVNFREDTSLTAVYAPAYKITLDASGGTLDATSYATSPYTDYKAEKSVTLTTKGDGTINGYVFDPKCSDDTKAFAGWYIGTEWVYNIDTHVFKEDTTLTAKYVPVHTITIDANGGTFNATDYSTSPFKYYKGEKSVTLKTNGYQQMNGCLSDPTYADNAHAFDGWYIGTEKIDDMSSYIFRSDATVEAHYIGVPVSARVCTPFADVPSGRVNKGTMVTFSSETPGASIFYTTDGTDPGTKEEGSTKLYTDAITINNDMTIKALAYKEDLRTSVVVTYSYVIHKEDLDDTDESARDINSAVLTSEKRITVIAGKTKLSSVKPTLSYNGRKLVLSEDYSIKFFDGSTELDPDTIVLNDSAVGKIYTVKIYGLGNFTGELKETVTVETLRNDKAHVVAVSSLKVVNNKKKAITFDYKEGIAVNIAKEFEDKRAVVYDGKTPLIYGEDYTILEGDTDNTSAGKHTFTVEGIKKADAKKKSYLGQKLCTYEIKGTPISKAKIAGMKTAVDFTGREIILSDLYNAADKKLKDSWKAGNVPVLYMGAKGTEKSLVNGKDYTVSMTNTGAVGKFDIVFTGMGGYTGTVKKTVNVKPCKLTADKLVIEINGAADDKGVADFVKSGVKPSVVVYRAGFDKPLVLGTDYTVSYKNNGKVGKSSDGKKAPTVLIKGKGNYAGTSASAKFTIKEASVKQINVVTKDVAFKAGKTGYWRIAPKLMDDGKTVTVGKNKDVELVLYGKDKFEYRYLEATKVKTKGGKGEEITREANAIAEKDDVILSAGATIKVTAKVICTTGKSNYFTSGESEEISGYIRIVNAKK